MKMIYNELDAGEEEKALHAIFAHPTTMHLIRLLNLRKSVGIDALMKVCNKDYEIVEAQVYSLVNRGLIKYDERFIIDSGLLKYQHKVDRNLGQIVKDDAGVKHVFFDPVASIAARALKEVQHIDDLRKEVETFYNRDVNIENVINALQNGDLLTCNEGKIDGKKFSKQYFQMLELAKN